MGSAPKTRKTNSGNKRGKINKQDGRVIFRTRHVDQVWEDVRKPPEAVHDGVSGPVGTISRAELDEETPGFGKHYCIPCARYFQTAVALVTHEASKPHKRKAKFLAVTDRPHRQRDAEAAAGVGAPDNGPKLRSAGPAVAAMVE